MWREIWNKKVVQWLVAYAGFTWLILQIVSVLAPQFKLDEEAQKLLTWTLLLGAFPTLSLAWQFGETGKQEASPNGLLLILASLLVLILGAGYFWTAYRAAIKQKFLDSVTIAIVSADPPVGSTLPRNRLKEGIEISVLVEQVFTGASSYSEEEIQGIPVLLLNQVVDEPSLVAKLSGGTEMMLKTLDSQETTWVKRQTRLTGVVDDQFVQDRLRLAIQVMHQPNPELETFNTIGGFGTILEYPITND